MNWKALLTGPAALAVLLTAGNAVKPPVVDDTAYLLFARHLSQHPLDPYGWELFWYDRPASAMLILLPPVLPYWLAAGIRVVGEDPTLLKLWLFPVSLLLTRSAWWLFGRFAPGWEWPGTTLLTLGPAVLPLFNFMLDVPTAAVTLAALAAFVRGCDANSDRRVLLAGVLAGLAMQTKYTALTLPVALWAYALLHRRWWPAPVATLVAALVFVSWESLLRLGYGTSHFQVQFAGSAGLGLAAKLVRMQALVRPLFVQLGGLTFALALLGGWSLGLGRRWLVPLAAVHVVGLVLVALVPDAGSVLHRNADGEATMRLSSAVYLPAGTAVLAVAVVVAVRQLGTADGRFLAAWLVVELLGYFALTPFPASRRVLPVALALSFLVGRAAAGRPARWPVAVGVAVGVAIGGGLLAVDSWDAAVEPAGVAAAARVIGDPGPHAVWTQGHWGWQYAADRRGWKLTDIGRSRYAAGDFLVLPVAPVADGFFRPWPGPLEIALDPDAVQLLAEWVWEDRLAGQTVPNLYGGVEPLFGRDYPRLRVRVYRVTRDWTPASAGTP